MSNLVKSFLINNGEEKRIIDYNELINEKIKAAMLTEQHAVSGEETGENGFFPGLEVDTAEVLEQSDEEAAQQRAVAQQQIANANAQAESIVAEARAEADRILQNAKAVSDTTWKNAYAEAKKEGFNVGVKEGRIEIDRMRNDLDKEKKRQQKEYTELLESMEGDLVGVMLEVFEKVTKVLSADKKDVMVHLIENALKHVESSKEFVVRVSKDDYQFVLKHKEFLVEAVPQNGSLEVIKDVTLGRNECLIETDGGVFDCGLDTQLENLIADIKALSCM